MQVWVRLFRVGSAALRNSGGVGIDHVSRLRFRVGVGDIDVNLHMNNGRYLTIMDLGRIDLLIRTGLYREMRRRKITGVVAVQRVRYRVALDHLDRFRLDSRILGWSDEGIIFDHRVLRLRRGEEKLAATATVRFVFTPLERGGARPKPAEVLRAAGILAESPALPEEVVLWLAAERRSAAART